MRSHLQCKVIFHMNDFFGDVCLHGQTWYNLVNETERIPVGSEWDFSFSLCLLLKSPVYLSDTNVFLM